MTWGWLTAGWRTEAFQEDHIKEWRQALVEAGLDPGVGPTFDAQTLAASMAALDDRAELISRTRRVLDLMDRRGD